MQLSQFLQMRCTVAQTTAPRTITFSSLSSLSKSTLASDADSGSQWILPVEVLNDLFCIHGRQGHIAVRLK